MRHLPVHSHHRAPLIHHLSRDLPSTTAAELLHTTASYVRQCKRKSYDDVDLLQDRSVEGRETWRQKREGIVWREAGKARQRRLLVLTFSFLLLVVFYCSSPR